MPKSSVFKGYRDYVVQELITTTRTTKYLLELWQTPEGKYVTAEVPIEIQGWHYGPELRKYITYQYHFNRVTQPKIHKELLEKGIDISRGEVDRILRETTQSLEQEKDDILAAGIAASKHLQSDDTGARHKGKNGYCNIICNDLFAYFHTSNNKSRVNFLKILSGQNIAYKITTDTLEYMKKQKLPAQSIALIKSFMGTVFVDEQALKTFLTEYNFNNNEMRIIAEGVIMSSLISSGFPRNILLLSDDAGQFNLFDHALCWVHAERNIRKIIPIGRKEKQEIKKVRSLIWKYYRLLKAYKKKPSNEKEKLLLQKFDAIFTQEIKGAALRKAMQKIYANKNELLKVLKNPWLPLHNNTSEQNLRDIVIKRKISGGTRSDDGRRCRDIANSIMQTCFKLGISFWQFLGDRISNKRQISYLPELIRQKSVGRAPPI